MNQKRTIAVITSSRADYSHLYWPLRELRAHPDLDLRLMSWVHICLRSSASAGRRFRKTALRLLLLWKHYSVRIPILAWQKPSALGSFPSRICSVVRPDILLLIADRYELLAPASVALALRIPIAHIEGGEISEGAIDDAVRNALTKMSHIHFTSTEEARARVISMEKSLGECIGRALHRSIILGAANCAHIMSWKWSSSLISQSPP